MVDRFIELLMAATAHIPELYFQLPVAGQDDPVYRERVYCYELYHQMRVLIKRHDDLQAYALSGEIDKQGHQVIRPCSPDLVFHQPGDMRENIAVVEVKPANEATDGIRKDLSTLSYFVNETVRYQVGIHLIYGGRRADLNKFEGRHRELNLQRLRLYWHEAAGLAATRIL